MRTTITMADDVAAAVEQLRRELGVGPSAAVNELVRRGLAASARPRPPFVQATSDLGHAAVDLDDVAAVIESVEGSTHR